MVLLYDSSAVLSLVLEARGSVDHVALWESAGTRLASDLLRIECLIAVRRAAILQGLQPDDEWATSRLVELERLYAGMTFKTIDESIEQTIRENPSLARCRSLDAIHLATALYLRPHLEEPLALCSLDRRLREAAAGQGFAVLPESVQTR